MAKVIRTGQIDIDPNLSSEERESSLFDQLVEQGMPHEIAAQIAHDAKASMDELARCRDSTDDPMEALRRLALSTRRTLRALIALMGICFVIALADLADMILRHL